MFLKNTAEQKWRVFAYNRSTNEPALGVAATITAKVDKDQSGSPVALLDTNPAEIEDGFYLFDLTKAESNASILDLYPESSDSSIQVIGVPGTILTQDESSSSSGGGSISTGDIDIVGLANAPKRTRTEEGTVEERSVSELIDAQLATAPAASASPWGIRLAKLRPGSTT